MQGAAAMLKMARRRAGLTQRELARRAGVPQPTVSRIERARVSPSFETLAPLIDACGMQLEVVDRPGDGVDRTLIRQRLAMTPTQRLQRGALEWNATRAFRLARIA